MIAKYLILLIFVVDLCSAQRLMETPRGFGTSLGGTVASVYYYPQWEQYKKQYGLNFSPADDAKYRNIYLVNVMAYIEGSFNNFSRSYRVTNNSHLSYQQTAPALSKLIKNAPSFGTLIQTYNKTYSTPDERAYRQSVFERNMKILPVATSYSDLTPDQFQRDYLPSNLVTFKNGQRVLNKQILIQQRVQTKPGPDFNKQIKITNINIENYNNSLVEIVKDQTSRINSKSNNLPIQNSPSGPIVRPPLPQPPAAKRPQLPMKPTILSRPSINQPNQSNWTIPPNLPRIERPLPTQSAKPQQPLKNTTRAMNNILTQPLSPPIQPLRLSRPLPTRQSIAYRGPKGTAVNSPPSFNFKKRQQAHQMALKRASSNLINQQLLKQLFGNINILRSKIFMIRPRYLRNATLNKMNRP